MAAFVKSLAFMILVVTVSAWERQSPKEEHLVKVEFELPHVVGAGPFRLVGNTSVLGNGNPLDGPLMDPISSNYAVLYVNLTAGETYSVSVYVDVCPCPSEPKIFKVHTDEDVEMGVWLGDKACNILCPEQSMHLDSIRSVV